MSSCRHMPDGINSSASRGLIEINCLRYPEGADRRSLDTPGRCCRVLPCQGHFDLVIKVYPDGVVSSYMFGLKVGDKVTVKGPFPKFDYSPNVKKEIGMIAGGTGITPMLQVLQEIMYNSEDRTKVTLVFANKSPKDIMLKDEIDALAAAHDNLEVIYLVDGDPEGKWTGKTGHVSADLVKECLPAPSPDNTIFVCGPPGMMKAVSGPKNPDKSQGDIGGILKDLGFTSDMVYKF